MKVTPVFEKNLKAYAQGHRLIVNKGGARSGKTVALDQLNYIIQRESSKHIKTSIVSHSFPHLQQGAIYELEKIFDRDNITDVRHHSGKHEFYINKSILNYFSLDKEANKAVGPGRDILYLNEPNRGITFEQYKQLRTRTTGTIFLDYNPSSDWWLQEEGIIDEPGAVVIHSTWLDNLENLSEHQIDDFVLAYERRHDSDYHRWYWDVYGEGKDGVLLEERIMPFIKKASKVPKEAIQIPSGIDFGFFPDPTVFVDLFIVPKKDKKQKDKLYIKQRVYETHLSMTHSTKNLDSLADRLKSLKVNFNNQTIAECAEPLAIQELRDVDMNIEAVVKQPVESSIRLFHDYEIYIIDGSDETYKEFNSYKYKRDGRTNKLIGIPAAGQDDHAIDAVRYVLMSRDLRWSV